MLFCLFGEYLIYIIWREICQHYFCILKGDKNENKQTKQTPDKQTKRTTPCASIYVIDPKGSVPFSLFQHTVNMLNCLRTDQQNKRQPMNTVDHSWLSQAFDVWFWDIKFGRCYAKSHWNCNIFICLCQEKKKKNLQCLQITWNCKKTVIFHVIIFQYVLHVALCSYFLSYQPSLFASLSYNILSSLLSQCHVQVFTFLRQIKEMHLSCLGKEII